MNTRRLLVLSLAVLGTLPLTSAHASPLLELAGSMGDQGGQQGRVAASGASAAYFNPALLADVPTSVNFGFVVLGTGMDISLDARTDPRQDVPNDLGNASRADGSRWPSYPLGTDILENGREESPSTSETAPRPRGAQNGGRKAQTYESIGIVASFLDGSLGVGFWGLIPNSTFLRLQTNYVDEREQFSTNSLHPEMYGDRIIPLALSAGLGYRFNEKFSFGLGSTFVISAVAGTPVYVADASRLDELILNVDARAKIGFAPHAGLTYNPIPRLRLTATLHSPQKQEVVADINYLLASGLEQGASFKLVFDWMPWQVGLGTAYDLVQQADTTLSLVASAVYGRWSKYVDRHAERPAAGLAFQDTITGALGLRGQLGGLGGHLDFQYKPTPVPPQFGRSNYVDNDRLGAALGAEYAFTLGKSDTELTVGIDAQLFWLLRRHVEKLTPSVQSDGENRTPSLVTDEVPDDARLNGDPIAEAAGLQTNNPGWPGFSSGGWVASAGLYLQVAL